MEKIKREICSAFIEVIQEWSEKNDLETSPDMEDELANLLYIQICQPVVKEHDKLVNTIIENIKDSPSEYQQVVEDNFWKLI